MAIFAFDERLATSATLVESASLSISSFSLHFLILCPFPRSQAATICATLLLSERQVWRNCAPIYPPAIEVSKHLNALLFLLQDGVEKVGEDGVVAESKPVQGLGTCTEQVSKSASCVAPLHDAGFVDWPPPSCKVIRSCQSVCT